jgi:hypothetical protein
MVLWHLRSTQALYSNQVEVLSKQKLLESRFMIHACFCICHLNHVKSFISAHAHIARRNSQIWPYFSFLDDSPSAYTSFSIAAPTHDNHALIHKNSGLPSSYTDTTESYNSISMYKEWFLFFNWILLLVLYTSYHTILTTVEPSPSQLLQLSFTLERLHKSYVQSTFAQQSTPLMISHFSQISAMMESNTIGA